MKGRYCDLHQVWDIFLQVHHHLQSILTGLEMQKTGQYAHDSLAIDPVHCNTPLPERHKCDTLVKCSYPIVLAIKDFTEYILLHLCYPHVFQRLHIWLLIDQVAVLQYSIWDRVAQIYLVLEGSYRNQGLRLRSGLLSVNAVPPVNAPFSA